MRRLLAVLGKDVSRSLSPYLHGEAARACSLDVAYVPVSCPSREDFDRALDALAVLGALGANVTIPYKIAALERSAVLTETAREIGAVNTLSFAAGGLEGDNTDGPGLVEVLCEHAPDHLERVQILGAGGAARAAVWAAKNAGAGEVHVSARSGRASALASTGFAHELAPVAGATLVISTLPPEPALASEAITAWIDLQSSPRLIDLAYRPGSTPPLAAAARARGFYAIDGLPLLVAQAALSLAKWTGGDLSAIRSAMEASLSRD